MVNKIYLGLILALFFSSCAKQIPTTTINLTIKSDIIKFKGQGFLKDNKGDLNLDLYTLGKYINTFKINEKICFNNECYTKKSFNEKFFGKWYYDDLLKDIILCKNIFSKKNYSKTQNGFTQIIDDLTYVVDDLKCEFSSKNIIIKINK
ncbi:hypothetical protein AVBRAN12642_08930 [Campylobacter sp. RM12642]|uniref:hypothetical protein n=1 Tax=Campylobacter sp. RM12642 TaxID=2735736 RepID=UPI0030145F6D|nr:hypothetical protein [Campylobacter sp. RM12642]